MLATVFNTTTMEFLPQTGQPAAPQHLLVIDPDSAVRSACVEIAEGLGYVVESTGDVAHARRLLDASSADILLMNLPAGSTQGLDLVSEVKMFHPHTAVIAMTASGSVNTAVEAMRCGASDYLMKPFAMDHLLTALDRASSSLLMDAATRQLREKLKLSQGLGAMIGRSAEMEKVYRILSKVAQSSHPVLILGESGTGKELVARTIHAFGPNAEKPFLPVDCGSLAPTLIESELCLATSREPSRAPCGQRTACWLRPRAELYFWTRSASFRLICRQNFCGHSRSAKYGHWARPIACRSEQGSWRPPIANWRPWWRPGRFARTCSTG